MRGHPLPAGEVRGQRGGRDGLDLVAQQCQRATAQAAQHVRVDELGGAGGQVRTGGEPPGDQCALAYQRLDRGRQGPRWQAEPGGEVGQGERSVGAGVAAHEVRERLGHRFQDGGREPGGQGGAQRVAQAPGVLHDRDLLASGHAHRHDPARGGEVRGPARGEFAPPRRRRGVVPRVGGVRALVARASGVPDLVVSVDIVPVVSGTVPRGVVPVALPRSHGFAPLIGSGVVRV